MRLLHTSDWHLGRSFHREGLLDAQRAFLDHLVKTVRTERVDAVLVAGDVYDRALPSLEAVALFDDVLHRLADLGVPAVFISGNHDSARRLGVAAGLIRRAGIHLHTDPAGCAEPVLLEDGHGPVAVYGLPYLEPALVREELGVARGGHAAVLGAAMDRVRADLAARPAGTRSVVLAHAFVTGGEPSDSERDITVGGVASVPASVFDGVDYAALGHLHGCQTLTERLRYSGSPLAYSFSEARQRKSVWLVDLGADGAVDARRVDCPVPRPLACLRGRLEDLLADPDLTEHQDSWVQVTLTDPGRPADPMERLRQRFPHTLQLLFEPDGPAGDGLPSYAARTRGRSDLEVAEGFVRHVRPGTEVDAAETGWLREAFEAVRQDADRREEAAR
ncbi:exonuclease SbcCD subunit D [Streptacidiphilus sp. ASG 303]|uniref:exonuclease SbcCD subunit D n=1 Tax=Streptacidiphilus sp. ASG 303 TaxID=2896847 RepID=UPI001E65C58B|nr:exonuclease SbcCD subunit D [Streptacidiphilus sp. ASG 303]MCD0484309.1 exonuclease SbcCD subunit D [Streptacidiphilus sp. ASG 303]